MKATISVNHRVSDGAEAAQFMQALSGCWCKSKLPKPFDFGSFYNRAYAEDIFDLLIFANLREFATD